MSVFATTGERAAAKARFDVVHDKMKKDERRRIAAIIRRHAATLTDPVAAKAHKRFAGWILAGAQEGNL